MAKPCLAYAPRPQILSGVTYVPVVATGPATGRSDERNFAWFLRGVVAATPVGPVLRVRGHEFGLPSGTSYSAGAELRLKLVFEGAGWQLQILGPAGAQASAPSVSRLHQLIAQVGLPLAADQASRLLPVHLPPSSEAVSTLLHRLAAADGAGSALATIVGLLANAQAHGVVPTSPVIAAAVIGWLVGPSGAPEHWKAQLRRSAGPTPEAVFARMLLGEPPVELEAALDQSPEYVLAELARDEVLTAFARETGVDDEWQRALSELAGRKDGERLLSLHQLSSPYRFIELPIRPEFGWRRAQVHMLGGPASAGTAVIDVETEALGGVWMSLSTTGSDGALRVQADRTSTFDALTTVADDIPVRLAAAGCPNIAVSLEPWDGDRLSAAVTLFDTYRSVELTV